MDHGVEKISFDGEPFIYNGEELIAIDDGETTIDLSDYLIDDKLPVINIPIIEYGDELDKIIDVTDDTIDGFNIYVDKFGPNYITILLTPELQGEMLQGHVDSDDEILPNLFVSDLEEFEHDVSAGTLISTESKHIFRLHDRNLLLQFFPDPKINIILQRQHSFSLEIFL